MVISLYNVGMSPLKQSTKSHKNISLSSSGETYLVTVLIAQNAWTAYNDFLGCLQRIHRESPIADVTLDFSNLQGSIYPEVAISFAGLVEYFSKELGWTFHTKYKLDSYVKKAKMLSPIPVRGHKKFLSHGIFDKVIRFESPEEASFISLEIYRQLRRIVVCEEGVLGGLGWCMNEIMDNVTTHSNASCGYFMAQIHNRKKVVSVSVFDLGCGLLNSLKRAPDLTIDDEMHAIELATQKGVTENVKIGQGNGLYGLRKIIEHNKSHFSILSGHCSIAYDFGIGQVITKAKTPIVSEKTRATRVDFTVNYASRINLRTALDGYQMYEDIDKDIEEMSLDSGLLVFPVGEKANSDFVSRAAGRALRNELYNYMKACKEGIVLDFQGIPFVDSSFADEFLGKLVAQIGVLAFSRRCTLLHLTPDVQVVLERAISLRVKELFDTNKPLT